MKLSLLPLLVLLAGCPAEPTVPSSTEPAVAKPFDTPEATLATVVKAIRGKDLELYKQCFTDDAHKRGESALTRFQKSADKTWAELQGLFNGPQSFAKKETDGDAVRVQVDSPEAKRGGIGSMSFRKVGGEWKIENW